MTTSVQLCADTIMHDHFWHETDLLRGLGDVWSWEINGHGADRPELLSLTQLRHRSVIERSSTYASIELFLARIFHHLCGGGYGSLASVGAEVEGQARAISEGNSWWRLDGLQNTYGRIYNDGSPARHARRQPEQEDQTSNVGPLRLSMTREFAVLRRCQD